MTVPLKKAPNGVLINVTPMVEDCPAKIDVLEVESERRRLKSVGGGMTSSLTIRE